MQKASSQSKNYVAHLRGQWSGGRVLPRGAQCALEKRIAHLEKVSAGESTGTFVTSMKFTLVLRSSAESWGKKIPHFLTCICFALKEVSQLNIIETADGKMQTL